MARVNIQVLGSGDAFGSGGRFQTCFLVAAGDERFVIDCGATALVAMRRFGVAPETIDAVFLSHLHGDHFGGLPSLLLEAQFVSRRERPLTVAGPPGTEERLLAALEVFYPGSASTRWSFPLRFVELAPVAPRQVGGVTVTAHPVVHPSGAPSYALQLDCAGRRLAYSGDTAWTDQLIEVARGSDLLIVECYSFEPKASHHLDFGTLSRRRAELDTRRILLTHMSQEMLGRLDEIDWEAAEDGLRLEL